MGSQVVLLSVLSKVEAELKVMCAGDCSMFFETAGHQRL